MYVHAVSKKKYVHFHISSKDIEDDLIRLVQELERSGINLFISFLYFHITNRIISAIKVFYEKPILHFCCFFISTH